MNVILPLLQQFKDNRWFKQVGCIEGEFSKTITLNLPTTNLGQQLYFNSDTELDNAIIKTIEVVISTNQINTIYQNSTLDTISSGYIRLSFKLKDQRQSQDLNRNPFLLCQYLETSIPHE